MFDVLHAWLSAASNSALLKIQTFNPGWKKSEVTLKVLKLLQAQICIMHQVKKGYFRELNPDEVLSCWQFDSWYQVFDQYLHFDYWCSEKHFTPLNLQLKNTGFNALANQNS